MRNWVGRALAAAMLVIALAGCIARRQPRVIVAPTYSYLQDPLAQVQIAPVASLTHRDQRSRLYRAQGLSYE